MGVLKDPHRLQRRNSISGVNHVSRSRGHVSTSCFLPLCISSNTVRWSGHHHEPLSYSSFCTSKNEPRKAAGNVEYLRSEDHGTEVLHQQQEKERVEKNPIPLLQ